MKEYHIHTFGAEKETAAALAALIADRLKANVKQSVPLNMAVSGGNTPKMLFELLAEKYTDKIPWKFLRLFWVDERCVPPTHKDSNFGMTYTSLLEHVDLPSDNLFRIQGENNPDTEVIRYADVLKNELPQENGFPVFDLMLLGIGNDGHTASIFPSDLSLFESDKTTALVPHPETGQLRITLTGKTICNAKEIAFFVTGAEKANILSEIIAQGQASKKYPASYVSDSSGVATFYLDGKAAGNIPNK
ncbi:MAG: 6-phosphogluconolactonase [Prevotellaceae bacterium]|jgi:6-phosphogluconolactonase|nr:6-phosphogluconolactonase [Prevotellaceae bacterium]